jgi:hypothetical protein
MWGTVATRWTSHLLHRIRGGFVEVAEHSQYNLEAIEQCRTAVSGLAGPVAAIGDELPKDVGAATFGELPSSGVMASALNALTGKVDTEYDKAGTVLQGVDRALDAIGRTVTEVETGNKQALAG